MPDPNNVVLRDCGVVFMLLPKVANTSIKTAILQALDRPTDNIHAPGSLDYVDAAEARRFPYRFAVVRDPLTRLASCYRDKFELQSDGRFLGGFKKVGLSPEMSFREFVEAVALLDDEQCVGAAQHFRSMAYSLCDAHGLVPNVLLRFETLLEDWSRVQRLVSAIGGPALPALPHERQSGSSAVTYTPRTRAFALQRYRQDIRLFGYTPSRKYVIDPDAVTRGRSICNVLREAYREVRDHGNPDVVLDLIAEAFDMGKRMNAKIEGSQYE